MLKLGRIWRGLAAGVAAGRFSPVDIVEACLARIRKGWSRGCMPLSPL